jgi:predicted GIY-YIG superfamily endonuclease
VTNKSRIKRKKRPTKGALIKGMTGKLPLEILDSPVFRADIRKVMKGYSGIYLLYRRKSLYYVGLTGNLLARLKSHQDDKHASNWDRFTIYRIKHVRYLKDLETLLTGLLSPPGNSVEGRVPRDADINRILRRVLKEQEVSIRKIRKAIAK